MYLPFAADKFLPDDYFIPLLPNYDMAKGFSEYISSKQQSFMDSLMLSSAAEITPGVCTQTESLQYMKQHEETPFMKLRNEPQTSKTYEINYSICIPLFFFILCVNSLLCILIADTRIAFRFMAGTLLWIMRITVMQIILS